MTRARISPEGERQEPTQRRERRIKFDHRLLLIVLAAIYIPLFVVIAWAFAERAS